MSKKHYLWAADSIVSECMSTGIDRENCYSYVLFVNFFSSFNDRFDVDTFDKYIDKKLSELQK